ncbi:hypothetical protein GL213_09160 [Halogeometricum borinquense]|uniref:DUF7513 domain-containing protein n=2 Tax=Halogeometricum borinquense TaxID=60847 RepID=E4NMZ7_HALBP|nr:hypothetical protein [Halogeometricum borinquense]ADQ67409.1 hypothetical protein Hbor_18420 [Halogeometricum borinquense DSM 11551]ELY28621.1 hypothetical protein C499_08160 [Halogeometricum borinquense DSM 11551]QIB74117.1 hypothetical protein G3I44_07315 [Halogeometricum borinquense]QIQ76676.1 hypothetical protein GL213_09160 [Halogeometricum borinquense]RYJ13590.1 hypothetical protein ELS19_06230 [Halogeometricum borinquense]
MSLLEQLTAGLRFRTTKPTYDAGDELTAFVTGANGSTLLVRVGDSVIELPDEDPSLVDGTVRFEVESFDKSTHRGRGKLLEVVEEPE